MRLLIQILIFVLSLAVSVDGHARAPKAYIDMEPGPFAGPQTVFVDGKQFNRGFWAPGRYDIAEAMKGNTRAFEYAQKHEAYAAWAGYSVWGGLGGALAYLIAAHDNVNYGVYWGIFGTGLVTSLVLQKCSIAYLYKAVNAYNDVDSPKTSQLDFSIIPIASGAALGLSYNF